MRLYTKEGVNVSRTQHEGTMQGRPSGGSGGIEGIRSCNQSKTVIYKRKFIKTKWSSQSNWQSGFSLLLICYPFLGSNLFSVPLLSNFFARYLLFFKCLLFIYLFIFVLYCFSSLLLIFCYFSSASSFFNFSLSSISFHRLLFYLVNLKGARERRKKTPNQRT